MIQLFMNIQYAALVSLLGFMAFAAQAEEEAPLNLPHLQSSLETDTSVTWGRLDNGLIYAVMPNHEPKDKLSLRLYVRVGSMQEEELEQGLAHYLEHMGFNGSKSFPKANQVIEELQQIGVAFGRDSNAHTGFDETVYKLDMPDNKSETLSIGLRVFSDWSAYLHNNEKEVNDERGIILSEMRDRDGPDMRIWQGIYPRLYPGLTLGNRFPIGTKASIEAMTAERIRAFYKKWYRMDRMVLTVVGNVSAETAVPLIEAAFKEIPKPEADIVHPQYGKLNIAEDIQYYAQHEAESDSTFIYYAVSKPHVDKEDGIERRRLSLHKQLVNSIMNRRLADYVEDNPEGAILSGGLSMSDRYGVDLAAISVQPKPERVLEAIAVLEQELRRMRQFGPSVSELNIAVSNTTAALEQSVSSKSRRSNKGLATALYSAIKNNYVFQTPEQNQTLTLSLLKEVHLSDIQAAIDIAFNNGNQFLGLFGRENLGPDTIDQLRKAYETSAALQLEAKEEAAELTWAYAQRPATLAAQTTSVLQHDITALQYANKVRANVLARSEKENEILMQVRITIDDQPLQPGVREAFSSFMDGGLKQHDAKALRQVLAGKRCSVGVHLDQDAIILSGSCPPEELELMLQIARAWITDAGWREDGFKRNRVSWLESLSAQETDLEAMLGLRMSLLTNGGLTYLRSASLAEAKVVQWSQVKDWAQPIFNNGAIELSLVGDFEQTACIELLNAYMGSLAERKPVRVVEDLQADGALLPISSLPNGQFRFEVDATVQRAIIRVLWPTDDAADVKQVRRLGQLSRVVSDKLRTKIREQLGDAYSPYAGNSSSSHFDKHGYFLLNVGIAPERVNDVLPVLHEVIAELLEKGIDDDLFKRVMVPTISSLAAYRSSNGYWLGSVLSQCQSNPQRLDWATNMEADYQAMTIPELMELAEKYLRAKPLEIIAVSKGKPVADPAAIATPSPEKAAE